MSDPLILGLETSCDETSAAVLKAPDTLKGHVIYSQDEHILYGGVVPEIAARAHIQRIDEVVDRALVEAGCTLSDIDAVAVTAGEICAEPRREFYSFIDAANVDLKGFTERFYRQVCGGSLQAVDEDGEQLFRKGPSRTGIHRHAIYIGPAFMSGYTVQADVLSTAKGRRRPDIGLINSGYTLDLQGNHQRIEVRSWAAELRMAERFPFEWETDVWYTLKLQVDADDERALIRGKVWRRGEAEPIDWTVTVEDPEPVRAGSPGLIGYSPIDIYYDNVSVTENP